MNNKRDNRIIVAFGRSMTMAQWAEERMMGISTLALRLKDGWQIEKALIQPPKVWSPDLGRFIFPATAEIRHKKIDALLLDITGQRFGMLSVA